VTTYVQLCISVGINMKLKVVATFKHLPTVMTVTRPSVAVSIIVLLQVARSDKAFVTQ